jgi:hypothetical protein
VPVCSERKVLLADCRWLVRSERKSTRTNEHGVNLEWVDIFFESLSTDDEGNLWSDWAGTQQVPTPAA